MNKFNKLHPFSMLLYFMAVIGVTMFCSHPVFLLEALMGAVFYLWYLTGGKNISGDFAYFFTLFVLIAITNPLFSHNGVTPLFFMNSNPVTLEAVLCGVSIATALIAVILWFSCMTRVFTTEKFMYLFGRVSPKLSHIFSMSLCFIPKLRRNFAQTENAVKALGMYSCESRFDRLKLKLRTFSSVLAQSAENAIEASDSMQARGYGGKKRTYSEKFTFRAVDIFTALWSGAVLVLVVLLRLFGMLSFEFYPRISEIALDFWSTTTYVMFGMTCLLPLLIEMTESLKWKYFVSKI